MEILEENCVYSNGQRIIKEQFFFLLNYILDTFKYRNKLDCYYQQIVNWLSN